MEKRDSGGEAMNKLPIFSVLGRAVGFVFGELLTIVRLSWFPLLLLFAASYFWQKYFFAQLTQTASAISVLNIVNTPTGAGTMLLATWLFSLFQIVITAMVAVALHRIVLFGERKPGTLVLFSFGRAELLYVLMFFFYFIVIGGIFFVIGFSAAAILGTGRDLAGQFFSWMPNPRDPRAGYMFLAFALVVAIPVVWFVCRTYVLPPAIVATRRFALGEVWNLTKGNVWRIIALNVLAILFLLVVAFAILKFLPADMVPPAWHLDFYTAGTQPIGTETIKIMELQQENWILYMALNYAAAILMGAFGVGLMSHSYKALKSGDDSPETARESTA